MSVWVKLTIVTLIGILAMLWIANKIDKLTEPKEEEIPLTYESVRMIDVE